MQWSFYSLYFEFQKLGLAYNTHTHPPKGFSLCDLPFLPALHAMPTSLVFTKCPSSSPTACAAQSRERAVAFVVAFLGNVTTRYVDALTFTKALGDTVVLLILLMRQERLHDLPRPTIW